VVTYLAAQAILIIGGNIRLLPITGVTLPFVSYGGSSYVSAFFAITLVFCMESPSDEESVNEEHAPTMKKALPVIGSLFMIALLLIEVVLFWWGFVRADDLQRRSDNPRLIFADLFVPRGTLYDRDGDTLAVTQGETGSYYRAYPYAALSNTVGFSHSRYGRSGIEESLNDYLRGYAGYSQASIWLHHLTYDQPPAGIDIHLTLDLDIQRELDSLFNTQRGAAIVLDGAHGDILAIASHPGYDANQLQENWDLWNQDEAAPFLNRVMQGSYPAGSMLIPFLLDEQSWNEYAAPSTNGESSPFEYSLPNNEIDQSMLQDGCYAALYPLLADSTIHSIEHNLESHGFFSLPSIGLPLSETYFQEEQDTTLMLGLGQHQVRFSPLLVAQAVLQFNFQGDGPALHLVMDPQVAADIPAGTSSVSAPQPITPDPQQVQFLLDDFFLTENGSWSYKASAFDESGLYQWFVQSTSHEGDEKRTIVVIVLENASAEQARSIGNSIYSFSQANRD
jgi:hypothetical protein